MPYRKVNVTRAAAQLQQPLTLLPLIALGALAACFGQAPPPPPAPRVAAGFAPPSSAPTSPASAPLVLPLAAPIFTSISDRCALAVDGRLFCFGKFFPTDWTPDERDYARPVFGFADVALFDTSPSGICLVRKSDPQRLLCAAEISTYASKQAPLAEWLAPEAIREISTTNQCAIGVSSAVYCWGNSTDGYPAGSLSAEELNRRRGLVRVDAPPARAFVRDLWRCIATEDGRIGCWGNDNPLQQLKPKAAATPSAAQKSMVGQAHAIRWWPGADLKDLFRYGTHKYSAFGNNDEPHICTQSRADRFACPDPKLTTWLNQNQVVRVHSYFDSLLALTRDGRALSYRMSERSKKEYVVVRDGIALNQVAAIGTTAYHDTFCMLDTAGAVKCMGYRDQGALGSGERLASPLPLKVPVPPAVELTSNGSSTTCVRQVDGGIHCWGGFDGVPDIMSQRAVTELHPPEPSRRIVGSEPICSLGKTAWFCGAPSIRAERTDGWSILRDRSGKPLPANADLNLGILSGVGIEATVMNGSRLAFYMDHDPKPLRLEPIDGIGLPHAFDCYTLKQRPGLYWSRQGTGSLRSYSTPETLLPRKVLGGEFDGWLLTDTGDLYFGSRAAYNTSPIWEATPRLRAVQDAVFIEHPEQHKAGSLCALLKDASLVCAGPNRYGELGDGTFTARTTFQVVQGIPRTQAIANGHHYVCALGENGDVHCWGSDVDSALGQGTKAMSEEPQSIVIRDR